MRDSISFLPVCLSFEAFIWSISSATQCNRRGGQPVWGLQLLRCGFVHLFNTTPLICQELLAHVYAGRDLHSASHQAKRCAFAESCWAESRVSSPWEQNYSAFAGDNKIWRQLIGMKLVLSLDQPSAKLLVISCRPGGTKQMIFMTTTLRVLISSSLPLFCMMQICCHP